MDITSLQQERQARKGELTTSSLVPEKGRFRALLAIYHLHTVGKCDFWTKLLTKANSERTPNKLRYVTAFWPCPKIAYM